MRTRIKICGLSAHDALDAALDAGVDMVGFVFFTPSPRHLSLHAARELAARVEGRAKVIALTVDANDASIDEIARMLKPDAFQLHGAETPARVAQVGARTGCATVKAIGVATSADALRARDYAGVADTILFDAKPPRAAILPGGNGATFDWTMLRDAIPEGTWMLSGGLHARNIAAALEQTQAASVDVSSGVEAAPGIKDPRLIREFVAAVRGVSRPGQAR